MEKVIVVIGGPTASGKTDVAIQVAEALNAEILSADSRQCYREMSVGTAKPSPAQLSSVPHYFIDSHSIKETVSAGEYSRYARECMADIFSRTHVVVMAGGTGLYIQAALEGIDEMPDVLPGLRDELNEAPLSVLQEKIVQLDPNYAAMADMHNPRRLIRALEVAISSGKPYSSFLGKTTPVPYPIIKVALTLDRELLYNRINKRVDCMVENGLFEEAESLLPYREHYALKTVGYQEVFEFMDGAYEREEAISLIKQNTRRYAKRQLTWFRKRPYTWFLPEDGREIVKYVREKSH
jgi:tRNA dimethylallyltransferase